MILSKLDIGWNGPVILQERKEGSCNDSNPPMPEIEIGQAPSNEAVCRWAIKSVP
jgi:hypothetical protein